MERGKTYIGVEITFGLRDNVPNTDGVVVGTSDEGGPVMEG